MEAHAHWFYADARFVACHGWFGRMHRIIATPERPLEY
jgi:hypothetical protein